MAAGWYCKIEDQLLGPMPLAQLVGLAQTGSLQPNDMVRRKTGEWVVGHDIRGLFPADEPANGANAIEPALGQPQPG